MVTYFPVQHYVCLDDPRVLLLDGERPIQVAINNLIVEPLLLDAVLVHSHHLAHVRALVVALPGAGEVNLLRETWLVVIFVLDGDNALGVGVEVFRARRMTNNGEVELSSGLEVNELWVLQADQSIVGVDLERSVFISAAKTVDDPLFAAVRADRPNLQDVHPGAGELLDLSRVQVLLEV